MVQATSYSLRKSGGVHYTPKPLAGFVAARIAQASRLVDRDALSILDPACGDGELLEAMSALRPLPLRPGTECVGIDLDTDALRSVEVRLQGLSIGSVRTHRADFLELVLHERDAGSLWTPTAAIGPFDVVIANPPYVRTQVLGAERAQSLAERFGLSGRVDLYHAFLAGIRGVLKPGGVLGIITSNRFITTLGGAATRRFLARDFEILEIIDLGDSKLFDAAVLPAVIIARRNDCHNGCRTRNVPFISVYSDDGDSGSLAGEPVGSRSVLQAIESGLHGAVRVGDQLYKVRRGETLVTHGSNATWALTDTSDIDWVDRVRERSIGTFSDFAMIRVGIKTTADDVFIRDDWDDLPPHQRPEAELLRPLVTHKGAAAWCPAPRSGPTRVLYPHEVVDGRKRAVDLTRYPKAARYLELHRERLEGRSYVVDAGRQWYEIWVPQDPDAWPRTRIVFPDISASPKFFLDTSGDIVNGDCYWLTVREGVPEDYLFLILAVANSGLSQRFHDAVFNNRLYAGRRRYITQYVGRYPLPDPQAAASIRAIELARRVSSGAEKADRETMDRIDALIEEAFGVASGETMR